MFPRAGHNSSRAQYLQYTKHVQYNKSLILLINELVRIFVDSGRKYRVSHMIVHNYLIIIVKIINLVLTLPRPGVMYALLESGVLPKNSYSGHSVNLPLTPTEGRIQKIRC